MTGIIQNKQAVSFSLAEKRKYNIQVTKYNINWPLFPKMSREHLKDNIKKYLFLPFKNKYLGD